MTDARVPAFVAAWDCLTAIRDLEKHYQKAPQETREMQYLFGRMAELYTSLANSPAEVGEAAAMILETRREDKRRNKDALNEFLGKL